MASRKVLRFDPSVNTLDIQLRIARDGEAFFEYYDDSDEPIPQTGCEFELILMKKAGATQSLTLSTANGRLEITGDDDEQVKAILTQETSAISEGSYFYEFNKTDTESKKKTHFTGVAYVTVGSFSDPNCNNG